MNKIFTLFVFVFSFAVSAIAQTNWSYNFGTAPMSYTTNNSSSTTFFPNTPADGGTYRIRTSNGKGGRLDIIYPSTNTASGAEAKLTASTTNSTTKWGVYDWLSPSDIFYMHFRLATTSAIDGNLAIAIGNSNVASDGNGYTGQYSNSLAVLNIAYSGGQINRIERRNGSSTTTIPGTIFYKNTFSFVQFFLNNSNATKTYSAFGSTYSLSSQSWDLWVDGVKISPNNGFAKANIASGDITGFAFFGESSQSNSAQLSVTDLYYSTVLPSAPPKPTVSTTTASYITASSFQSGGNVTADGGASVTSRGIFFGLTASPTTNATTDGSGTGSFVSTASALNTNTKYFYRAYATNSAGTAYGTEYSVVTLPGQATQGTPDNATTDGFTARWSAPAIAGTETYTYSIEVDDDNSFSSVDFSSSIASSTTSLVVSGLLSNTTYYYRVRAVNATGSGAWSAPASITTAAITTPYLQTTTLDDFDSVCLNSFRRDSIILSGGNLNGTNVTVGAVDGLTYSLTRQGTYSTTLDLAAYDGSDKVIYIKFQPTTVKSYNANITISGGGASTTVAFTGKGINLPPAVSTTAASGISSGSAALNATVAESGCTPISNAGFEYSTTSGFVGGTVVTATPSGGYFSATVSSLSPNTTYYYKAFAENNGGKVYGSELSFKTSSLAAPVAAAASELNHNSFKASWTAVDGATGYSLDVLTDTGTNTSIVGWFLDQESQSATEGTPENSNAIISRESAVTYTYQTGSTAPKAISSNNWNGSGSKFWVVRFSSLGYSNLTVSSKQRSSGTGPRDFVLEYSLDSAAWTSFGSAITVANDFTSGKVEDVPLPSACDNQLKVYIRWRMSSSTAVNGTSVAGTGASRISDIRISALTAPAYLSGYSNHQLSGTSATIGGLNENTEYFYRVRAFAPTDTSNYSNIVSVITLNDPTTADYVSVANGNLSNAANWEYNSTGNTYVAATQPPTNNNLLIKHNIAFDQNFTLASGKSIVVNAGSTITVNSGVTLNLNNQDLILKSNAVSTAALGKIEGTLSNATNVTIERFIPAKRAWRFLAAPISHIGAPTIFGSWMESGNNIPGLGTHITGTGGGVWDSTIGPSIKVLNASGNAWEAITGTNTAISSYQSYMLFVRGDRTIPLSQGTAAAPTPTTLRITGTPLTGLQNKPVFYGKGFSDVGNPYPSAVDFAMLTKERTADLFYVWDPKRGTNGAWVTFTGPTYAPAEGTGGSYLNPTNSIIESGQAFIVVHDNSAPVDGGVTFEEDAKVDGNSGGNVFKNASVGDKIAVQLNEHTNGTLHLLDGATVLTDVSFNNAVNNSDVTKMINFGENIAFTRDGKFLVLEKRQPVVTENDTLFVALWNTQQKNYQLSLNLEIDPTITATLEDRYTNASTVLNNHGNTVYDFAVTADVASQNYQRFIIVLKPGSTLPCKFVSVGATKKEAATVVSFTVANELNIAEYTVERSANGKEFAAVGSVKDVKNNQQLNSYSFVDASAFSGTSYYRIKAIGKDGKWEYSSVVAVGMRTANSELYVYPNPVENGNFNLQLTSVEKGNYEVKLFDVSGKEVYSEKLTVASDYQTIQMNVPAMRSSGLYVVQLLKKGTVVMQQNLISK